MIEGLVSIIMPSYNAARFIGESINSVLLQTYSNWELLIVEIVQKTILWRWFVSLLI